jgi:DNA repair protein RadC
MNEVQAFYSIQNLPLEDRPRERLLKHGPESMSTSDLIAIILGSGMKGIPILQLSHEIVSRFGSLKGVAEATIEELCQIKGLGIAKAIQIKAAINLGLRASRQTIVSKYRIENPIHAYHLLKEEMENEKRELFVVIMQDTKGCVISHQVVAIGTLSNTLVHPREVFYPAIRHKAATIIIAHNHPSGDPTPSPEDYEVTKVLVEVGKLMGILINDHIIIGENCYISLRQKGFAF